MTIRRLTLLAVVATIFGTFFAPAVARAQESGLTDTTLSPVDVAAEPTIVSDKDDYHPGELVTLTGAGWSADEVIELYVNDTSGSTWTLSAGFAADEGGNFTYQFQLPNWFVADYRAVATGDSGRTATTTFTDTIAGDPENTSADRSAASASNAKQITIPRPVNRSTDDLLVAVITVKDLAAADQICAPDGWTEVASESNGNIRQAVFRIRETTLGSTNQDYTFRFRPNPGCQGNVDRSATALIMRYTGVHPSSPVDEVAEAVGTGSSSPMTIEAPAVTTHFTGARVISLYGSSNGTSITTGGGFQNHNAAGMATAAEDFTVASPTSTSANLADRQATQNAAANWVAQAVALRDAAGIADATPPSVTVEQKVGQADPTNTQPVKFTAQFSEPVPGFGPDDVTLGGTAGRGTATTVTLAAGSGNNSYEISVDGLTSDGTVTASIPAASVTDAAGNPNTASTSSDNVVVLDTTNPSSSASAPTYSDGSAISVTYSASDNDGGSGLKEVELWVKTPGAASSFTLADTDTTPASASFSYTPAAGEGSYQFFTRARDNAGNREAAPSAADDETLVDTTAPDGPSLTQPSDAAVTNNARPEFSWTAVSDVSGVAYTHQYVLRGSACEFGSGVTSHDTSSTSYTPSTALAANTYCWRVKATDGAGNHSYSSVRTFRINAGPSAANDNASQSIQYSDAIGPVTITGTDPDGSGGDLTASTKFTKNGGSFQNGLPTGLQLTAGTPSGHIQPWTLAGTMKVEPATYVIRVTISDPDGALAQTDVTIIVTKENAAVTYTGGLFYAGPTSPVRVALAATVTDAADSQRGDIRNAKVDFLVNGAVPTGCSNLPVGLVSLSDSTVGTATCNADLAFGSTGATSYDVQTVVKGWYDRNDPADMAVVNVAQAINGMITGGGYLVNEATAGQVPGDAGKKTNFGFNVKYNKSGTNLQGGINTIIRRGAQTFQVKGNSMTSLTTNMTDKTATFNGRASIQDITNPLAPVSVDGNATLRVTMTDRGEPGSQDKLGITVWNKAGGLWFSSYWSGTQTLEQLLGGGNLVVR